MKKVFEFFVQQHVLATLFTISILMLGLNTARTLKREQVPEVDLGEMIITTVYPGASPEDVELNVTNKIEDELKNVTGIKRMTSTSMENISVIDVMIEPDAKDIEKVKDDVRDAVERVTDFPDEVTESPLITEITTAFFPVIEVGITGDVPYAELREIARQFEKKLKNVPGVSSVDRYGYRAREVRVEVDPSAVQRYQVPLREIIQAIRARNIRLTGGTFESFVSEKNVVTLAQFRDPMEVGDVIVRSTFEGPVIRVKDLAVIHDEFEEETVISRLEGRDAISFVVNKSETADIIRTVKAIKKLIREEGGRGNIGGYVQVRDEDSGGSEKPSLTAFFRKITGRQRASAVYRPGYINILYSQDESIYVENSFKIVITNGLFGLVFVFILLALFLNIRTAFWVALGIPVSILGTIFLLPFFNAYLDSITLTSLVLVIGIVVDDGIIISEEISFRRERGDVPFVAASEGIRAVFFPVLTTVTTTIMAFVPMFFMTGVFGKFVRVIPLTVTLALTVSVVEATFALPSHLKQVMDKRAARGRARGAQSARMRNWFDHVRIAYRKFAKGFLRVRYVLVVVFIVLLIYAFNYARKNMGFILFPSKGAEWLAVYVECPTGTPLRTTAAVTGGVEKILMRLPSKELETFTTRIGIVGWVGRGENYANIQVRLTPFTERERTADQIVEELREKTKSVQGAEKISFEVYSGGPPVGRPITLRITGNDDDLRARLSGEVDAFLRSIPGVKDIDRDDKLGKEQLEVKFDYEKLSRYGLTVADVAQNVRIAYDGQVVTSLRQGDEDVEFRVQLAKIVRRDLQYLNNLVIPNVQGRLIRLGEVARIQAGPGLNAYRHFDGDRTTTITGDVDTSVTTSLAATTSVLAAFGDLRDKWPGMSIVAGGEAEETQASIVSLFSTFIIAIVGIYFLLVLQFKSFTQPFLVMFTIPFGAIGVIFALTAHNENISFAGMMGMIGLAGVVVNDAIVLLTHVNELRKQRPEADLRQLVAEGASDRLRAITLTTTTTVAGVLPIAYGLGGTNLFMAPMALTLGYGLIFATTLTLILVPCMYMIGDDMRRLLRKKK
jgi:multidrug efflux pump subunit AcrB